jgi:hypothetical protein
MAKDKKIELNYKLEGKKRMAIRKQKRLLKFINNRQTKKIKCNCGYYCYCDGSGYW